jgi:hypothetical protein
VNTEGRIAIKHQRDNSMTSGLPTGLVLTQVEKDTQPIVVTAVNSPLTGAGHKILVKRPSIYTLKTQDELFCEQPMLVTDLHIKE